MKHKNYYKIWKPYTEKSSNTTWNDLFKRKNASFWVKYSHLCLAVGTKAHEFEHREIFWFVLVTIFNLNNFRLIEDHIGRNHTFCLIYIFIFCLFRAVADGGKAVAAGDAIIIFHIYVLFKPVWVQLVFTGMEK